MLTTSESVDVELKTSTVGSELTLVTWAGGAAGPVEPAAEEAYSAIDAVLRERGSVPVQERVFGDLQAAPAVARARARAVGDAAEWAVPPTCVEGAPVGRPGLAGDPRRRGARRLAAGGRGRPGVREGSSRRLPRASSASRTSGAGRRAGSRRARPRTRERRSTRRRTCSRGRGSPSATWRAPGSTSATSSTGTAPSTRCATPRSAGWVSWARAATARSRRAPGSRGATRGAAGARSTSSRCSPGPGPVEMRRLHNRKQNEATEYGSAFARAMEVVLGDARYLFVSGTASIDDHGATVHVGDFETQTRYTLEAVEALLDGAGARLEDVGQATAFLANPCDGRAFERIVGARACGRRRSSPPSPTSAGTTCSSRSTRSRSCRSPAGRGGEGRRLGRPSPSSWPRRRAARGRAGDGPAAAPMVVAQVPAAAPHGRRAGPGARARAAGSSWCRRGGSPGSSPPPSTAPPTPRCRSTGSRSSSRGRRRPRTRGASSR